MENKGKLYYRVQGLDRKYSTKEEAIRQAKNLGAAVRDCCERLGEPVPKGITVTEYWER